MCIVNTQTWYVITHDDDDDDNNKTVIYIRDIIKFQEHTRRICMYIENGKLW